MASSPSWIQPTWPFSPSPSERETKSKATGKPNQKQQSHLSPAEELQSHSMLAKETCPITSIRSYPNSRSARRDFGFNVD